MRVALALVAALLLAGCLGLDPGRKDPPGQDPQATTTSTTTAARSPGDPTPPAPTGDIAMLLDFGYTGCAGFEANVFVPYADAQALLPSGYTAAMLEGFDSAPVQYLMLECDFYTPSATVNETVFGLVAVGLESAPVDGDAYLVQMLTQSDIMVQLWDAAGYGLYTDSWSRTVTGGVAAGPLALGLHDVALGDYQAQVVASTADADAPTTVTYLTETDAGRLVWTMNQEVAAHAVATGTFVAPAPLAQDGDIQSGLRVVLDANYAPIDLWLTP